MKGISTTLVIIVTAIVILVAALVVLTIFGGGMTPIVDWTSKQSLCMTEYVSICAATGSEPPAWNVKVDVTISGEVRLCSCADLVGECACKDRVGGCKARATPNC
ncbi:MAG: hypothetical protein KAU24_02065 [Candidatus Aenigmarchaeota archaeon]|nr:hypothetical protein [Candidatus Aenigmarchaeota archaeon]